MDALLLSKTLAYSYSCYHLIMLLFSSIFLSQNNVCENDFHHCTIFRIKKIIAAKKKRSVQLPTFRANLYFPFITSSILPQICAFYAIPNTNMLEGLC
uniref:Uncharacterized protein n=1 Tax=Arundo donax TaxID=35708 RepID=A0A0A9F084_ARUDO